MHVFVTDDGTEHQHVQFHLAATLAYQAAVELANKAGTSPTGQGWNYCGYRPQTQAREVQIYTPNTDHWE